MASTSSSTSTFLWLLLLVAAVNGAGSSRVRVGDAAESDRVWGLPGQPEVGFRHYSGYVEVGEGKALFYWFFEAEERKEEKPLLLWLNGGPGCSSIAYGAAQELGPFLVRSSGSNLTLNPYSWNKVANLLFLEAPVGVGFSYTNRSADLQELGDEITAKDSHAFLISWFKRFPSFKSHQFYISGESYAGHYVPQLANLIYEGNKASRKGSYINLKGIMIGNAVLNDATDQMGMVEYAWSHAIISDELYTAVRRDCNSFKEDDEGGNSSKACSPAVREFLQAYSDIDIYSIYTPVCLSSLAQNKKQPRLVSAPRLFSQHELWHGMRWSLPSGYDPCTEDFVETYFNREDVQRALHANITHLPYPYSPCRFGVGFSRYIKPVFWKDSSDETRFYLSGGVWINYDLCVDPKPWNEVIEKWNDSPSTVLPVLRKLMKAGVRVWVYSGDTDGRVPVTSTRYSINSMRLHGRKGPWGGWRAWFHKEQVAGWLVEYKEGLTLVTVRGAGHQVPVFAPDQALSLVSHFLHGWTLPAARFP